MIERLRSTSIPVRLKAISESESHADEYVRRELFRIFTNGQEQRLVRGCAALALGHLHDQRVVGRIVELLPEAILSRGRPITAKGVDPYVLGKALVVYGPESLPSLAPLLHDRRQEVVVWAVAQHGLYRHNDQALQVLITYFGNSDPLLRRAAAYGLAQTFHERAEPFVTSHLNDADAEVRYHLAWALSNYGSSKCLPEVQAQLAREKEPQVRQELTLALAAVKGRSVPAAVTEVRTR